MTMIRVLQIISIFMIYIGVTAFIKPSTPVNAYENVSFIAPAAGGW